jgi:parallel beta-helix repeat protein
MLNKKASGYVLVCLAVFLFPAFNVALCKTPETVFIRADGMVDPATAPITSYDNTTYIFTGNANTSIIVERDNVVVNGCGYMLQGAGKPNTIGMDLSDRKNITVTGLGVTGFGVAFELWNTSSIRLFGNQVVNNVFYGFDIWNSSYLSVENNEIKKNEIGVKIEVCSSDIISNNVISENKIGVHFFISSGNRIYGNYFLNNTIQVSLEDAGTNFWDNGYPAGGNYWSDFSAIHSNSTDNYRGSNQNQLGSDGFWDTAYVIDQQNKDNYPLTSGPPTFVAPKLFPLRFIVLVIVAAGVILCLVKIRHKRVAKQTL